MLVGLCSNTWNHRLRFDTAQAIWKILTLWTIYSQRYFDEDHLYVQSRHMCCLLLSQFRDPGQGNTKQGTFLCFWAAWWRASQAFCTSLPPPTPPMTLVNHQGSDKSSWWDPQSSTTSLGWARCSSLCESQRLHVHTRSATWYLLLVGLAFLSHL